MSEQYYRNIQALCDKLGIPNPIQENDLRIKDIAVFYDDIWHEIKGTEMNRAGRLFFQCGELFDKYRALNVKLDLRFTMAGYFAENWLDAVEKGRTMLIALQKAERIELIWK